MVSVIIEFFQGITQSVSVFKHQEQAEDYLRLQILKDYKTTDEYQDAVDSCNADTYYEQIDGVEVQ
jgi:hypothetical protein